MIGGHLAEVFAYPSKILKQRIVAVCGQRPGLSISKVVVACLEACIDDLEEQVGLRKPTQETRSKRKLVA